MKKYDALIIGFGKGGKTLAAALGKKGIKTAVIEKSPLMYGGTCINIGCIPTKKLIHTAADAKKNQQADYSEKNNFYAAAIREKNTLTALLRQKNYDNVAAAADIYTGAARFQTDHTVEVQLPDGKISLYGDKSVINPGSEPVRRMVCSAFRRASLQSVSGHESLVHAGRIGPVRKDIRVALPETAYYDRERTPQKRESADAVQYAGQSDQSALPVQFAQFAVDARARGAERECPALYRPAGRHVPLHAAFGSQRAGHPFGGARLYRGLPLSADDPLPEQAVLRYEYRRAVPQLAPARVVVAAACGERRQA